MTKAGSTNISRQNPKQQTHEVTDEQRRGLSFILQRGPSRRTGSTTTRCTHQRVPICVVVILEKICADLIWTRLEWADSEKGTRVLTSLIEGFETRFGNGSKVCEVDCEGPFRQPHGYTKVSQ